MDETLIFVGLDGEMSGNNINAGAELIQLAVYGPINFAQMQNDPLTIDRFVSNVALTDSASWSLEAESIHGITREEAQQGPIAAEVDEKLKDWLLDHGASEKYRRVVPVGMNVGSFDMPFLHKFLPKSASLFTRRAVDLNALCFTMDGLEYNAVPASGSQWKSLSLEYGRNMWERFHNSGSKLAAHDAEYDAWVHAFSWLFLSEGIRGRYVSMGQYNPTMTLEDKLSVLLEQYTIESIAKTTRVPEVFIRGWSRGGRARRSDWIMAIEEFYLTVKTNG